MSRDGSGSAWRRRRTAGLSSGGACIVVLTAPFRRVKCALAGFVCGSVVQTRSLGRNPHPRSRGCRRARGAIDRPLGSRCSLDDEVQARRQAEIPQLVREHHQAGVVARALDLGVGGERKDDAAAAVGRDRPLAPQPADFGRRDDSLRLGGLESASVGGSRRRPRAQGLFGRGAITDWGLRGGLPGCLATRDPRPARERNM